jgi:pantoate--beta-alanine ligase
MYPEEDEGLLEVGEIAIPWEGEVRPSHFRGVATVVKKLFDVVPADRAFFGQKDYQQTLVVQELVRNHNIPIKIEVCPTVRESDGLAMSSRNAYLSDEQRKQARSLWQAIQLVERWTADGDTDVAEMTQRLRQHFDRFSGVEVEYIAFLAAGTVTPVTTVTGPTVVALAARVGQTRLIDNHLID